jgi:hypothetical protein
MERALDFDLPPDQFDRYIRGRLPVPPPGGAGVVGRPTAATAEKGERIYLHILEAIRNAVFRAPPDEESDAL